MKVRTRFAPSPTGYLHVGSVRTALYASLYAKHHQGEFILRIEDTDRERSTQEAVQIILDGMQWLRLDYQEEPIYQSSRMDRYQEVIDQWLETGTAYRCNCSKERLDGLRQQQTEAKIKPRYDGHCRELGLSASDGPFVVRFKNPLDGEVVIDDKILGHVTYANSELDDLIIARSDGSPTYNFTVVVDDSDLQITHVIRGNDHLNNTPRQINMLKALGAQVPVYAHIPMILDSEGKKLSKRSGAASVLDYKEQGILPEALLNYLVRLGWSHGSQEIFNWDEMIEYFDLDKVSKSAARFDKEKLLWLNHHYMQTLLIEYIADLFAHYLAKLGVDLDKGPDIIELAEIQRQRYKTMSEMAEQSVYFYQDVTKYDEKAAAKHLTTKQQEILEYAKEQLTQLAEFEAEPLHEVIVQIGEHFNLKMGKIAPPIRVAVTGSTNSPSLNITLALLGKEKTIARIERALEFIKKWS